jgi:hypothetical protein
MMERIDRRIFGALRLLDAVTGAQVTEALLVTAAGATLVRNRRGLYVITSVSGMEDYAMTFRSAPVTPARDLQIRIEDPQRRYLPRIATVALPRLAPLDPTPDQANDENSVFRPADIRVFRAPSGDVLRSWAVIRATVVQLGNPDNRLAGALIRVIRRTAGSPVMARAMTDGRGEALIAVPGIAVVGPSDGNGAVAEFHERVTVEVIYEAAAGAVPDPDILESRIGDITPVEEGLDLVSGRETNFVFEVTLA